MNEPCDEGRGVHIPPCGIRRNVKMKRFELLHGLARTDADLYQDKHTPCGHLLFVNLHN